MVSARGQTPNCFFLTSMSYIQTKVYVIIVLISIFQLIMKVFHEFSFTKFWRLNQYFWNLIIWPQFHHSPLCSSDRKDFPWIGYTERNTKKLIKIGGTSKGGGRLKRGEVRIFWKQKKKKNLKVKFIEKYHNIIPRINIHIICTACFMIIHRNFE